MNLEFPKANKIRTKLLLVIDKELNIQKKSNKNILKNVKQDLIKKQEYYIIETEVFKSERKSFCGSIGKSKNKKNKHVRGGDISKSNINGNSLLFSSSTNRELTNDNNVTFQRKEIKYRTVCTKENIYEKINELISGKYNQDIITKDNLPKKTIIRSYSYRKKREDNHDEEYLLDLCDRLKMNQKNNNRHIIDSLKEKPKLRKKKPSKTLKAQKYILINVNNKKPKTYIFVNNSNENLISIKDKLRKKKNLTSKFYKNNNFSSCICFKPIQSDQSDPLDKSNKKIKSNKYNKSNKFNKTHRNNRENEIKKSSFFSVQS